MKRSSSFVCLALLLLLSLWLCGCGSSSSNSSSSTVSVSISPATVTVSAGATSQFSASVKNASNTNVSWQVNGVVGGNGNVGTISGTGLYTAPATVSDLFTVTVTAVSAADSSKTAAATVTVAPPISISPTTASVQAAQTQQFASSVTFSSNTRVSWQVNGVAGGNSTVGTITSAGLYTAPNAPPSPASVTVTAIASADASHTASATVTVTPAPIVISPSDAVVVAAGQKTFTATLLSATIQPTWSVSCASQTAGACGSIASTGIYTAPVTPPAGGTVTISANAGSSGNPSTGSVAATIQFGNATLTGRYVYVTSDEVGHNATSHAGTIVFNGAGLITGGIVDSTDAAGTPATLTGGTYTVGTDGRGTAAVVTSSGTVNLQFVLTSNSHGFVYRKDSAANQAAGTIELQQVGPTGVALTGSYALALSGITTDASRTLLGEAGSVIATAGGAVTGGILDTEKNLTLQTSAVTGGSWTATSSSGRGTLTVTTAAGSQAFAYYPIDATRARLIPVDGSSIALGNLYQQAPVAFSNSSFKNRYAFSVTGTKSGNLIGAAGVFSLDGYSSVTGQQFDGLSQTVFDFAPGTYSVTDAQSGRALLAWTSDAGAQTQYVAYPRSDGGFVLLETDGRYTGLGVALPQANLTVNNFFNLGGAFALNLGGSLLTTPAVGERIIGHLSAGTSPVLTGTIDGTTVGQATSFSLNLLATNLTPQRYALGIPSAVLTNESVVLYRVNDDLSFAVLSDSTRIMVGVLKRQY